MSLLFSLVFSSQRLLPTPAGAKKAELPALLPTSSFVAGHLDGTEAIAAAEDAGGAKKEEVTSSSALKATDKKAAAEVGLFADSDDVQELSPSSISDVVLNDKHHRPWIINYYAKWCPHCQHFAPTYSDTASRFPSAKIGFGAMNCADPSNREFCSSIGVKSYPTLRAYDNNAAAGQRSISPDKGDSKDGKDLGDSKGGTEDPKRGVAFEAEHRDVDTLVKRLTQHFGIEALAGGNRGSSAVLSGTCPTTEDVEASRGSAEDREHDAKVALSYTFSQGVLQSAVTKDSSSVLSGDALLELSKWLRFVKPHLSTSSQSSTSLVKLSNVVESATSADVLPTETWLQALRENPMVQKYEPDGDVVAQMRFCKTYTCGLWQAFHILTLRAGTSDGSSSISSAPRNTSASVPEVLERIKGFVVNFFTCDDCRQHFREAYDSRQFGLDRLAGDDAKGAALWLWRMHASVEARVSTSPDCQQARKASGASTVVHPWPKSSFCSGCWSTGKSGLESGSRGAFAFAIDGGEESNDDSIYAYLRAAYLAEDEREKTTQRGTRGKKRNSLRGAEKERSAKERSGGVGAKSVA